MFLNKDQIEATTALQEVRRLVAERDQKKRELDAIDRAISLVVGVDGEDRPVRPRLSKNDIRMLFKASNNECISKKKRYAVDSGMA